MNERIKEIAKQCYETGPIGKDGWPEYSRLNEQKFAKLIVMESIMQMAIQMDKFGDNQSNNPIWYKSEEAVKKHFEVEK